MSTVADVPSVASNPAVASIPCCNCLSAKILGHLLLLVAHRMLIVAGDPYVAKNTAVAGVPAAVAGFPWIAINSALLASLLLLFVYVSRRQLPASSIRGVNRFRVCSACDKIRFAYAQHGLYM